MDAQQQPPPPTAANGKKPIEFPREEVQSLLEQSRATLLEDDLDPKEFLAKVSATIVQLDTENAKEVFAGYASTIMGARADHNPKVMADCGIFGPVVRFKKPTSIDGSIALTSEALYCGRNAASAVKDAFNSKLELQQLPGIFFVPPPEEKMSDGCTPWGYYPLASQTSKVDESLPVAFVAWTNVQVHFVPHTKELRAQWHAMTVGGGFNGQKEIATPLFRKDMQTMLADWHTETQETLTWPLLPGQVFITHAGMPFCFSRAQEEEDYVVQAVGFEVLQRGNQRKKWWRDALTTGIWHLVREPEKSFCAYGMPIVDKPVEGYKPLFTPMTVEKADWLTGGVASAPRAKKVVVPIPVVTPAPVAVAVEASSPVPKSPSTGGKGKQNKQEKLNAFHALHTEYDALIKDLPPRTWDTEHEATVNGYRETLTQDSGTSKINAYGKCLKTLREKIEDAKVNAPKAPIVLAQLEECKSILDGFELAADAAKLAIRTASTLKKYKELFDMPGSIVKRAAAVTKLLEACNKLKADVDADNAKRDDKGEKKKRPRAPRASTAAAAAASASTVAPVSPSSIEVPTLDEEAAESRYIEGEELKERIDVVKKDERKFANMIKTIDRDDLRGVYENLERELSAAVTHNQMFPDAEYNVGILDAYHDILTTIWNQVAARPKALPSNVKKDSVIQLKDGTTLCFGNGARKECDGGDDACGESLPEYANGYCFSCFKQKIKERINSLDYASQELPKLISKATRTRAPVDGITEAELQKCHRENDSFIKKIAPFEKRYKKQRDAVPPLLDLLFEAENNLRDVLGADFLGESGGGDDEEEEYGVSPMDVDSADGQEEEGEAVADEDDDDEEHISYASGSGDDEPSVKKRVKTVAAAPSEDHKYVLADGILRAQIRTPVEDKLKKVTTAYFKGDPDSMGFVRAELKELQDLTKLYGFKYHLKDAKNKIEKEWPHMFASADEADQKLAYFEKNMLCYVFEPFEKDL